MDRSRGSRGYHSPGCVAPFPHSNRRAGERWKTVGKTGRVSGTSVLAGKKHEQTASSHRMKPSRLHIQSYISQLNSPYNTKGIHKPHIRHNAPHYIPYIHSQHTQPSQQPLGIPMHGFPVAGKGIEQADGSLGPIPPPWAGTTQTKSHKHAKDRHT